MGKMQNSFWRNGRLVGAALGAILRGLVVVINFGGEGGAFLFLLCLPPALLGALCGALTGGCRTPLRGALWGGVVSGLSFAVFVFPIAFIAAFFNAAGAVERFSAPYLLERVLVGAIAGGMGAWAGQQAKAASEPKTPVA